MATVDINSVADYFLRATDEEAGELISPLKLQKLIYYSQAWHLALYDEELFADDVEAWVHGPVAPAIFSRFSDFRYHNIPKSQILTSEDSLDSDVASFLAEVWNVYGEFSAKALEQMTHREDPWLNARAGLSPVARSTMPIPKESMREFYKALLPGAEE